MNILLFPESASLQAANVDMLFYVWLGLAGTVAFAIALLIVFFAVKYRAGSKANRRMAPAQVQERRNRRIEFAWIFIPLGLFMAMYVWAANLFYEHAVAPADAMEVYVVGKQWMWKLEHTGGQREIDELHVPAGRPIKLVMTSQDVIHSFFMPVFRLKQDVLPGRYTMLWFKADQPGDYHVFCSQYCGTDHSRMIGHVVVMPPADFAVWLKQQNGSLSMAARGAALYRQYGCSGCHGANSSVRAPRLEGLFGKPVQLEGGGRVIADERYIHDSILLPQKEIVAGYPPSMPSFQGQIGEEDMLDIIEYVKSLGEAPAQEAP
jgi:cytochrome c oxidase subunit II